ncbi:MAG: GntR family transcriptional regulator [Rhodobacteraceae bacterium]|nr:GntR family transcriptional regulator [Paracoccaceae bacterium]TVR49056.1 MAG: GntR family transcriptional regulator [Paracoccaceae bacterium]
MKIQAYDISKTASATTLIFDAIRQAIITGDLAQGEPLRQEDIARAFNVSRIPVREALLKLEQHGLITSQRYKGAVVAGLSLDEASEIFEFRALLEPEVIRRAVPQMSPQVLETAASCCEAFGRADDPMQWGDLNRRFHSTLYAASGLGYHMEVLDKAMDRIDPYLRAQLLLSDGMQRANREHRMIVEACRAGQADRAADLTRQHILGAQESLSRYWQK